MDKEPQGIKGGEEPNPEARGPDNNPEGRLRGQASSSDIRITLPSLPDADTGANVSVHPPKDASAGFQRQYDPLAGGFQPLPGTQATLPELMVPIQAAPGNLAGGPSLPIAGLPVAPLGLQTTPLPGYFTNTAIPLSTYLQQGIMPLPGFPLPPLGAVPASTGAFFNLFAPSAAPPAYMIFPPQHPSMSFVQPPFMGFAPQPLPLGPPAPPASASVPGLSPLPSPPSTALAPQPQTLSRPSPTPPAAPVLPPPAPPPCPPPAAPLPPPQPPAAIPPPPVPPLPPPQPPAAIPPPKAPALPPPPVPTRPTSSGSGRGRGRSPLPRSGVPTTSQPGGRQRTQSNPRSESNVTDPEDSRDASERERGRRRAREQPNPRYSELEFVTSLQDDDIIKRVEEEGNEELLHIINEEMKRRRVSGGDREAAGAGPAADQTQVAVDAAKLKARQEGNYRSVLKGVKHLFMARSKQKESKEEHSLLNRLIMGISRPRFYRLILALTQATSAVFGPRHTYYYQEGHASEQVLRGVVRAAVNSLAENGGTFPPPTTDTKVAQDGGGGGAGAREASAPERSGTDSQPPAPSRSAAAPAARAKDDPSSEGPGAALHSRPVTRTKGDDRPSTSDARVSGGSSASVRVRVSGAAGSAGGAAAGLQRRSSTWSAEDWKRFRDRLEDPNYDHGNYLQRRNNLMNMPFEFNEETVEGRMLSQIFSSMEPGSFGAQLTELMDERCNEEVANKNTSYKRTTNPSWILDKDGNKMMGRQLDSAPAPIQAQVVVVRRRKPGRQGRKSESSNPDPSPGPNPDEGPDRDGGRSGQAQPKPPPSPPAPPPPPPPRRSGRKTGSKSESPQ